MTNPREVFRRVREAAEGGRGIELSREETAWMSLAAGAYEAILLTGDRPPDTRESGVSNGRDARS